MLTHVCDAQIDLIFSSCSLSRTILLVTFLIILFCTLVGASVRAGTTSGCIFTGLQTAPLLILIALGHHLKRLGLLLNIGFTTVVASAVLSLLELLTIDNHFQILVRWAHHGAILHINIDLGFALFLSIYSYLSDSLGVVFGRNQALAEYMIFIRKL